MSNPRELFYKDGSPMREYESKIIEELMNEDKKQTAVDWMIDRLKQRGYLLDQDILQAKAMEKEQIIDDFESGYDAGWCMVNEYTDEDAPIAYDAEQYYKERYESNTQ